ncbi:hypothetical protein EDD86DRAFT_270584, partial [Gorgonomyces haynaldii]
MPPKTNKLKTEKPVLKKKIVKKPTKQVQSDKEDTKVKKIKRKVTKSDDTASVASKSSSKDTKKSVIGVKPKIAVDLKRIEKQPTRTQLSPMPEIILEEQKEKTPTSPNKPNSQERPSSVPLSVLTNLWIRGADGQMINLIPTNSAAPSAIPSSASHSSWSLDARANGKARRSRVSSTGEPTPLYILPASSQDVGFGWNSSTKPKSGGMQAPVSREKKKKYSTTLSPLDMLSWQGIMGGKNGILKFTNAVKINQPIERVDESGQPIAVTPPKVEQPKEEPQLPPLAPLAMSSPAEDLFTRAPEKKPQLQQRIKTVRTVRRVIVKKEQEVNVKYRFHAHLMEPPFPMPPKDLLLYGPYEEAYLRAIESKLERT